MKPKPTLCKPTDSDALALWQLTLCALGIGILAAAAAAAFHHLISILHNILFYGHLSFHDFELGLKHTPLVNFGPWRSGIILVPIISGLLVIALIQRVRGGAQGHGVPGVLKAIYDGQGIIPPRLGLLKTITAGLSIAGGASVGREGPIVLIGAAIASVFTSLCHMPVRQRIILLAAGGAGGLAATFHAPLTGLLFAIEALLVYTSATALFIVALTTITATFIAQHLFNLRPLFDLSDHLLSTYLNPIDPHIMALYLPFGVLCGLSSACFIRALDYFEQRFATLNNPYIRHGIGMLLLGIMLFGFGHYTGHYYIQGVGYSTLYDIFTSRLTEPYFLLALFACKGLATCLSLGSGSSGGIFAPALYLGATLGASYAGILHLCFHIDTDPVMYAMVGMGGAVAGITGAFLSAAMMVMEITQNYTTVLPMMMVVTTAYITRKQLCNENVNTIKLLRSGNRIPEGLQAAILPAYCLSDLMQCDNFALHTSEQPEMMQKSVRYIIHLSDGQVTHITDQHQPAHPPSWICLAETTGLPNALRQLHVGQIDLIVVTASTETTPHIRGYISDRELRHQTTAVARLLD